MPSKKKKATKPPAAPKNLKRTDKKKGKKDAKKK